MNISHFVRLLAQQLEEIYTPQTAFINAWFLVERLFNKTRVALIAQKEITPTSIQEKQLAEWLNDLLVHHKPLQYILGSMPFLNVSIEVKPPILIPRPETEEWCDILIKTIKKSSYQPLSFLDLCTGSGCIAIVLAKAFAHARVDAVDTAPYALELAKQNAAFNKVNISWYQSNLFKELPRNARYDVIVANPPYIDPCSWKDLALQVRNWEDKKALCAGHHGIILIEKIIRETPKFLTGKVSEFPCLWIEIGHDQGKIVKTLFEKAGFYKVQVLQDSNGKDRVVMGYYEKNGT